MASAAFKYVRPITGSDDLCLPFCPLLLLCAPDLENLCGYLLDPGPHPGYVDRRGAVLLLLLLLVWVPSCRCCGRCRRRHLKVLLEQRHLLLLLLLFGPLSLPLHALFPPQQLLHVGAASGGALLEGGRPALKRK